MKTPSLLDEAKRSLGKPATSIASRAAIAFVLLAGVGVVACSAETDPEEQGEDEGEGDGEDSYAETSEAMTGPGPCEGTAIDRAVRCAQGKGARVLSFYRSPAEQERVRRENRCRNRCIGMSGCVRPTANCQSSPHTRCRSVDLVADGSPVSRAELKKCGLAKTTLPHANHYDLVD